MEEEEDEVTFLLRLRPSPSPPVRRRKTSGGGGGGVVRPVSSGGWDVVVERQGGASPPMMPSAPPPGEVMGVRCPGVSTPTSWACPVPQYAWGLPTCIEYQQQPMFSYHQSAHAQSYCHDAHPTAFVRTRGNDEPPPRPPKPARYSVVSTPRRQSFAGLDNVQRLQQVVGRLLHGIVACCALTAWLLHIHRLQQSAK